MDRRIMDMECTLWRKGTEQGRTATWEPVPFPCHWEQRRGSYRSVNGQESEWRVEIICPYGDARAGDKVALGTFSSPTPPADAYTVIWTDMLPLRGSVHHYEVYAG